jgi:hypothetical protein
MRRSTTSLRRRADLLVAATASAFNDAGPVWVPHYRQAALGAFLTHGPARDQAIDLAYADIRAAFDALPRCPQTSRSFWPDTARARSMSPGCCATGCGQRSAARVVAAYVIGWPVSARAAPALGLPACAARFDRLPCRVDELCRTGATPPVRAAYARSPAWRKGTRRQRLALHQPAHRRPGTAPMPASANLGTLLPDGRDDRRAAAGARHRPARCTPRGLLLIGPRRRSDSSCSPATITTSMIFRCSGPICAPISPAASRLAAASGRTTLPDLTNTPRWRPWHVDFYRRSRHARRPADGRCPDGARPRHKTIGVALCDAGWRIASPGKTIIRGKFAQDKAQIAQIIAERAVKASSSACRSTWTGRKARAASRAMPAIWPTWTCRS